MPDSTSRSRRRDMMTSPRTSSRNFCHTMPSSSSRWRKVVIDRLFSSAMRCRDLSSVESSTLMPVSLASCNCTMSLIMRSSNCLRSASCGGNCVLCACNCLTTTAMRLFKSLAVMTSLLTMATMRSSSTTPPVFAGVLRRVSSLAAGGASVVMEFTLGAGVASCALADNGESAAAAMHAKVMAKRCFMVRLPEKCGMDCGLEGAGKCSTIV